MWSSACRASAAAARLSKPTAYRFDLGPTFFLYPLVLERIFRAIGRNLRDDIEMVRLDPQYRLISRRRGELRCTPNVERMKRPSPASAADSRNLLTYLPNHRRKLDLFRPALETAFLNWRGLFRFDMAKMLPFLNPHRSVDGDLKRYFADPARAARVFVPVEVPRHVAVQARACSRSCRFLEYEYGVTTPLAAAPPFRNDGARGQGDGVRFHLDQPVEEILFEGKRAVGVRTRAGRSKAMPSSSTPTSRRR